MLDPILIHMLIRNLFDHGWLDQEESVHHGIMGLRGGNGEAAHTLVITRYIP